MRIGDKDKVPSCSRRQNGAPSDDIPSSSRASAYLNVVSKRSEPGASPRYAYAGSSIERAAVLRSDDAKLTALGASSRAGFYLFAGESVLLKRDGERFDPLFSTAETNAFGEARETIFLGLLDEKPRFARALGRAAAESLSARRDLKIIDLRSIAVQGAVANEHLPPLAEAKALLGWHLQHGFCSNCGAATTLTQAGWRRDCPSCKTEHFPRTDPVVIMLPIERERCVLGRSPRFPETMWSCLAGFTEPGESIEEAVRREIHEEVGLLCARVTYFASQPWPFPSSLMIGCHAEAISDRITIDPKEIEEARWFDREELQSMLALKHPRGLTTPPPIAIAHHIIRDFVEHGAQVLG
jgi:NAD+ diphosphatase